jgi:hypothetical protein
MLYREIIAVCSEIHTKHINTLCGQNVELLSVKPGCTYSNRWGFKGMYELIEQNRRVDVVIFELRMCWNCRVA